MAKEIYQSNQAPAAIGPYVHATGSNGLVFTSGQLGIDIKTGELAEGIEAQTRCSLNNVKAVLEAAGTNMSNVLKTTIFVSDLKNFATVNSIYAEYFTDSYPARSTVEVAGLPKGGLVEIEAIAIK